QSGVAGKSTLQATVGTDLHMSANAKYTGGTWNRYDTSMPSWNIFLAPSSGADFAGIRRASAGSGAITWADFLRITNTGNVGVGTAAPGYKLDVVSGGQWAARFKKTDATNGGILVESAAGYNPNVALSSGGTIKWYVNSNVSNGDALQFWESTGINPRL